MASADTPGNWHEWEPFGPHLTVIVGQEPDQFTFSVNQSMIVHYSAYFRYMAGDYMLPDLFNGIRLPGDSPEVFQQILAYCMGNNGDRRFVPADTDLEESELFDFDRLIDIYSFASKRGMPLVQNHVIDLVFHKVSAGSFPDRWSLEYLWEKTAPGTPLRIMVVELARLMWIPDRHKDPAWERIADGESEYPEILIKMMADLCNTEHSIRVSSQTRRRHAACEWHFHYSGQPCEGAEEFILDRGERAEREYPGWERGGRGPYRGIQRATDSPSFRFG